MKLTVSVTSNDDILSVDVPDSLTLEDFKAYLQAETDIEPKNQVLQHEGNKLNNENMTLKEMGIKEGDLVILLKKASSNNAISSAAPESSQINSQIEYMRQQFLNDPQSSDQLRNSNPQLHSILNDPEEFRRVMTNQLELLQQGFAPNVMSPHQQEELKKLQDNPDDPESQSKILEIIRQEQIDDNMKLAYEISPESFASVNMLYINISVNGHKVQAFVDTGAQATIISPALAEKIGISRLIDRRFQGEARGVGSQKIEGKIHSVPISIGESEIQIPCSFMVIDTQVDLLFGLDMMRRHKCVIDLQRDVIVVGGNVEAKLLHESEIERKAFGGSTAPSGFGGNIFSEGANVPPANIAPSSSKLLARKSASASAAEAAVKRNNTGNSSNSLHTFKQEDVKTLVGLGFSNKEAIFALEQTNGNVEQAASLLFQ